MTSDPTWLKVVVILLTAICFMVAAFGIGYTKGYSAAYRRYVKKEDK